jgi:hypothetical protein
MRWPRNWLARSTLSRGPAKERSEVLAAFAAHKPEVTEGYLAAAGRA